MASGKATLRVQSVVLVVVLLVANTILGFWLARETEHAMAEQIRARMMDVASAAAELVDGDALKTMSAADAATPDYERTMNVLLAFKDNVDLAFIYCVRERPDGSFEFTIDPSDDPAAFGETAKTTSAMKEASQGTAAVDLQPYEDRWGRFYSAYCPVFDSQGHVGGIVAVDFNAGWYEDRAASIERLAIVNAVASFLLALVAVVVMARFSRSEARYAQRMLEASRYDSLTGLATMAYFFETAEPARTAMIAEGKRPAMVYVDVSGMKFYNRKWGFAEGDKLLKEIANLLAQSFGHENCSRFGQDHFVVSTHDANLNERLDAFMAAYARLNDSKTIPLRIGVYTDELGEADVSTRCDRAKLASRKCAVDSHSTYCYFDAEMLEQTERRQYAINNIDRAITEGWIQVYYQPIVRTWTGKVCDEESLARWVDPERGLLSPADFVPALEDAKLAYKLDLAVLEQTLAKMQRMRNAGLHVVPASINLSRSDFEACDIVEEVRMRVDAAGISRNMVNLEITETAMGLDFDYMRTQVERLHDLGFKVWMDDFGSEYSSLDYLQSLHFDLIKLDMRFMRQFDNGARSRFIVSQLVKMAMGLNIETVCEGVETREQVDFLREIGCSKLQGFYYARPTPVDDILARYEKGIAIGFENPDEAEYCATVGRVNLYDLASVAHGAEDDGLREYFDVLPMAIVEVADEWFAVKRCNESYRGFMEGIFGDVHLNEQVPYPKADEQGDSVFTRAIRQCAANGERHIVDETMFDGSTVHSYVCCTGKNPVSGVTAVTVAVLAVAKPGPMA